jgi:hypothetical protein
MESIPGLLKRLQIWAQVYTIQSTLTSLPLKWPYKFNVSLTILKFSSGAAFLYIMMA